MTQHTGHSEERPEGIVYVCACGWVSRPCFMPEAAAREGQLHRDGEALLKGGGHEHGGRLLLFPAWGFLPITVLIFAMSGLVAWGALSMLFEF